MSVSVTHGLSGLSGLNGPSRGSGRATAAVRVAAIYIAVDRPLRAVVGLGSLASGVGARHLVSLAHSLSCQWCGQRRKVLLRRKTQVRGRSNRAIAARPIVCSALGGEPRGDRENPRQQRLIEQVTQPRIYRKVQARRHLPPRKGVRCQLVARGVKNSVFCVLCSLVSCGKCVGFDTHAGHQEVQDPP